MIGYLHIFSILTFISERKYGCFNPTLQQKKEIKSKSIDIITNKWFFFNVLNLYVLIQRL